MSVFEMSTSRIAFELERAVKRDERRKREEEWRAGHNQRTHNLAESLWDEAAVFAEHRDISIAKAFTAFVEIHKLTA